MSGNLLSKNHPFRASVTHGEVEIVSPTSSPATTASSSEENSKSTSKLHFSPKTKLISLLTLGLVMTYGWIQIYDSIYPPKKSSIASSDKQSKNEPQMSHEEISDFEWGYNDAVMDDYTSEQSKPSWFKQTFCKGVKRSFFCR